MNELQDAIVQGLVALRNVSPEHLEAYGELLLPVVGGGISAFFMFMKSLFKINRPVFMFISVALVSFAAGGLLYLAEVIDGNPAIAGGIASLSAYAAYHVVFKPVVKKYVPKLAGLFSNAKAYKLLRINSKNAPVVEEDIPGRITSDFSR